MMDRKADPLGRDTINLWRFIAEMIEHAQSRKDRDAIDAEIAAAEKRLGITRPKP